MGDQTYTYTYDGFGNILTANGHTYTYSTGDWKDLLLRFDGELISCDGMGSPTSSYNGTRYTFTWENGRSLATATDGTTNISYAYDADGLRTSKTVNSTTTYFFYAGGQLLRQAKSGNPTDFFYDANGYPYAMKRNGVTYYYITNLQGDVMKMVDAEGNVVASYEYDPYGKVISASGTMAHANPLRYRGYYYDDELGMYYLQSRYYDPNTGRFINADDASMLGTSGTVLGYNLFSYCENNPVNILDESGYVGVPWQVKIGIAAGVASAIWEMGKYIAGHRDQKVTSWAYIKGLGTALIKGFVRGFVVGVISTIPKNLAYGLLGGSVYLIHGLVTGSVKTVGQGVSAFMNGWTNGVYTKTLNNMLGNLGRLTGWSSGAMDKLEYITSTFLGFGLSRFFVW